MRKRYTDISGQRFGRLTALHPLEKADELGSKIWHCACECGNEINVPYNTLIYGNTRSCGCKKHEQNKEINKLVTRVAGTSIDHLKSKKIPSNNTSGVKGVYQDKRGYYIARIAFRRKIYYLGAYKSLDEAAEVRRAAEEALNGQVVNFYERWKERALRDSEWAQNNPVSIEIVKKGAEIEIILLPHI